MVYAWNVIATVHCTFYAFCTNPSWMPQKKEEKKTLKIEAIKNQSNWEDPDIRQAIIYIERLLKASWIVETIKDTQTMVIKYQLLLCLSYLRQFPKLHLSVVVCFIMSLLSGQLVKSMPWLDAWGLLFLYLELFYKEVASDWVSGLQVMHKMVCIAAT